MWFRACAALVRCEVSAIPEQRDAPRPHHQVSASPAQEEETTQHQRPVPGQCCCHPLLDKSVNYKNIGDTSAAQQPVMIISRHEKSTRILYIEKREGRVHCIYAYNTFSNI